MSYYGDLVKNDVIHWMKPLLDNRTYHMRLSDGNFIMAKVAEPVDAPWHHIGYAVGAMCPYLHQQLFAVISPRTDIGQFVPRRCQSCWKIVIRPRSLKQLFALEALLMQLKWPSKCGIERRAHTPLSKYPYGGYIYNSSVDEGLDRLDQIRKLIPQFPGLDDKVECYLKRACTEMELACPGTDKWEVSDRQNEIEDILDWLVKNDIEATLSARHVVNHLHKTWVEWAAQHGDETYLEYTGGQRLYPDSLKYERKQEEPELELEDSAPEKE